MGTQAEVLVFTVGDRTIAIGTVVGCIRQVCHLLIGDSHHLSYCLGKGHGHIELLNRCMGQPHYIDGVDMSEIDSYIG